MPISYGVEVHPWLRRHAVHVLDGIVVALAVGLMYVVLAFASLSSTPQLNGIAWCAILLVPVLSRFDVGVTHLSDDVMVSYDTAVLVFLLLTQDPLWALLAWAVFMSFAMLGSSPRWSSRILNIALSWLTGLTYSAVYLLLRGSDPMSARSFAAVLVASGLAVAVDLGLSWFHVALEQKRRLRVFFSLTTIGTAGLVVTGIASIGFLAALVVEGTRPWALVLLAPPIVAGITATRSGRRSREDHRRLQVLLESSRDRHDLNDVGDIIDSAKRHAMTLLATPRVEIRSSPPTHDELGALLEQEDGTELWLVGEARPGRTNDRHTDQQALQSLAADTSESMARSRLIAELTRLARTDALTGLASRSVFSAQAQRAVGDGHRTGQHPAVLYLDLDGFKLVNDRFGHHIGDGLVRVVGDRLREFSRPGVLIARLGGDEFALLLDRFESEAGVMELARRIAEHVSHECAVDGQTLRIGTSVGVAVGGPEIHADQLLRNADMAMYEAKTDPDGIPHIFHDGLRTAMLRRAELQDELRNAIQTDQLRLEYQPVVDMATGLIQGAEALARWEHPERGLLSAGEFIEVAEDSGLIRPLGEWVMRRVIHDAPALETAAGRPLSLAMNVSPRQLSDDVMVDCVVGLMASRTFQSRIVLELTESAVLDDRPEITDRLRRMVDAGACLAMDDFGVGYSSVGYLRWLPLTVLKLDRSLIASTSADQQGRDLVQGILLMGNALGLEVVAEGVEDTSQQELLVSMGCTLGQGYHLAKPQERDRMIELLRDEKHLPSPRTSPRSFSA